MAPTAQKESVLRMFRAVRTEDLQQNAGKKTLEKVQARLVEKLQRLSVLTQYELTSPIFYMEQYIPFSLIIYEPFSRILEALL